MKQLLACLAGIWLIVGCAQEKQPPKDLVSSGLMKFQPVPTNEADLPTPKVALSDDVMMISGVVKRKPDYNGPLDGHVKIELLDASGQVLEQFPIEWQPQDVPLNGTREAEYALNYGWVPPEGTTLRVSVVEDVDSVSVASGGAGGKGPRAAGNPQGPPTKAQTPGVTGHPKSGFAGGTAGTPRQASSTPRTPGASRSRGRGHR